MIEQGAILEVAKALPNLDNSNSSVKKTIGFAEISQYLQGEISLESACNLASQKTRNYVKRQLTWINNRFSTALAI